MNFEELISALNNETDEGLPDKFPQLSGPFRSGYELLAPPENPEELSDWGQAHFNELFLAEQAASRGSARRALQNIFREAILAAVNADSDEMVKSIGFALSRLLHRRAELAHRCPWITDPDIEEPGPPRRPEPLAIITRQEPRIPRPEPATSSPRWGWDVFRMATPVGVGFDGVSPIRFNDAFQTLQANASDPQNLTMVTTIWQAGEDLAAAQYHQNFPPEQWPLALSEVLEAAVENVFNQFLRTYGLSWDRFYVSRRKLDVIVSLRFEAGLPTRQPLGQTRLPENGDLRLNFSPGVPEEVWGEPYTEPLRRIFPRRYITLRDIPDAAWLGQMAIFREGAVRREQADPAIELIFLRTGQPGVRQAAASAQTPVLLGHTVLRRGLINGICSRRPTWAADSGHDPIDLHECRNLQWLADVVFTRLWQLTHPWITPGQPFFVTRPTANVQTFARYVDISRQNHFGMSAPIGPWIACGGWMDDTTMNLIRYRTASYRSRYGEYRQAMINSAIHYAVDIDESWQTLIDHNGQL